MLVGHAFDPTVVSILLRAFENVVVELKLQSDADRERAARIIIRLADDHSLIDAAKLSKRAVALFRNEMHWRRPF
jgi:hypothetical protein